MDAGDNGLELITLGTVEPFMLAGKVRRMMRQNPNWLNEERLSDIGLCDIIDRQYVPPLWKVSYVHLTFYEVQSMRSLLSTMVSRYVVLRISNRTLPLLVKTNFLINR